MSKDNEKLSATDIVICENCGAEFGIHEPTCPFCGHINPIGAEEQYMQKMQDIKTNLAEVDDQQIDAIKEEARKGTKIVWITMIVIAVIAAVLFLAYSLYVRAMTKHFDNLGLYESDPVEIAKWNDVHLEDLDAMYEAGDIEGLVSYYENLQQNGNIGAFNSWEHSFLINEISNLRFWIKYLESDTVDDLTIHSVMFDLLYYYNGDYKGTLMPEEDYQYMQAEFDRQMKKVFKKFNIPMDVMDDMKEKCVTDTGYVDPQKVSDYCDKHKDLFK